MSVLHLISDTDRRGAQVFAFQLAAELSAIGVDGSVSAVSAGNGDALLDVPVLPTSWRARRSELRQHNLVIAHGSTTLDVCAATIPGRFVYRSIGDPRFWLHKPAPRIKTGLLHRTARAVVVLYPDAADAVRDLVYLDQAKIHVIANAAVEPVAQSAAAPPLPATRRNVLYVGALSWEKQVDHLITAVANLGDTGLVLVGDGQDRAELESLAHRTLGDGVLFTGVLGDPWPYYRACDVLGLTSKTEGIPACILEAALASTPAVAYGVGGVPSTITDGQTGRVVPPGSITELSGALRTALDHSAAWGSAAADKVRVEFGMTTIADKWATLIRELTATSR